MTEPKPKSKHEQWIEDIREADGVQGGIKLTSWEQDFVTNVESRLESDRSLTPAQVETLEKIWDRI
jgi:hypothetical protein